MLCSINLNYLFQFFALLFFSFFVVCSVPLPFVLQTPLFCFPLLGPVETTHKQVTLFTEMGFDDDNLRSKEI